MLGLYPDYLGSAILALNGPEFTDERIHLPSGKLFTLHADGASERTPYIQSLQVNGATSDKTWLDPSLIQAGGLLEFVMGGAPNTNWGAGAADPIASAGIEATPGFAFATPNPLAFAAGASAELTLMVQSARPDVSQEVSWNASAPSVSLGSTSGRVSLAPGARATSTIMVHAPGTPGNSTIAFHLTSSLGPNLPPFVLPVVVTP